ncbi:MAG: protein-glutamine glutaminase family protein [Bdellovibrionales bacterium]
MLLLSCARSLFLASVLWSSSLSLAATPQEEIQRLYDVITEQAPASLGAFTEAQRNELFQKVSSHPVAGLEGIGRYDRQPTGIGDGEIGFCYGRAMAVHLLARKMGLEEQSIKKIFIAGDLNNQQGTRWRFHMATMVKGNDGKWYVIDPIMPSLGATGVLSPYRWMEVIKTEFDLPDGEDESRFYVTDTKSIMVDMRVVPATAEFENQDRLIEPSFDPEGRPGFERVQLQIESESPFPVYAVSGPAQSRYFIMRKEDPLESKPIDDFDFFSIAIVILYPFPNDTHRTHITRAYHYNGYFVDLINSIAGPEPMSLSDINSNVKPRTLAPAAKKRWLYGFAQPRVSDL